MEAAETSGALNFRVRVLPSKRVTKRLYVLDLVSSIVDNSRGF